MGKAKGIIMIAAGAIVLAVGIQTFVSAPERTGQIESAVYIENGQVLPENDGKLVIVSGKLEAELPLEDSVTGVKLMSPAATRNVQIYEAKTIDNETTWDWEPVANDYSEEGNGGINTIRLLLCPQHLSHRQKSVILTFRRNSLFRCLERKTSRTMIMMC